MNRKRTSISVVLLCAGALAVGVACGGDKEAPGGGAAEPSSNQEELVSGAFLADVADRTNEVETLSGEFEMEFGVAGETVSMSGDMAVADGVMHMDMRMFGQQFELLMDSSAMYMHVPDEGWFLLDPESVGLDADAFGDYFQNKGIIDLESTAAAVDELEALPNDDIAGVTYAHYRGSYDVAEAASDPETRDLLTAAGQAAIEGVTGTTEVELWIDPDTLLPRRVISESEMFMPAAGGDFEMTMQMDFLEFDGEVDIPDIPTDVRDISELEP